jgi:hypothetical protein
MPKFRPVPSAAPATRLMLIQVLQLLLGLAALVAAAVQNPAR